MDKKKIYLSSPTMHGEELEFIKKAFETNWVAPLGPNVDAFEEEMAQYLWDAGQNGIEGQAKAVGCDGQDREVASADVIGSVGVTESDGQNRKAGSAGAAGSISVTESARQGAGVDCTGAEVEGDANCGVEPHSAPGGRTARVYAAALSSGTAAIHLALINEGIGRGDIVFCQDLTFSATCNPIVYQGAQPVFIDSERESWNLDPVALRRAFELYPQAKAVIVVNLYGTPAKLDEIAAICEEHQVPLIEDAAESLGASYKGRMTGTFGAQAALSFNGNKIITTSGGGMLLSQDEGKIRRARFLATQAREPARHYEHKEIGYNYRMSNVVAGIGRGQMKHLEEHIEKKKAIYEEYREAFEEIEVAVRESSAAGFGLEGSGLKVPDRTPGLDDTANMSYGSVALEIANMSYGSAALETEVTSGRSEKGWGGKIQMNPIPEDARANYWLSCLLLPEGAVVSPTVIMEALGAENIESRPIWKPMHLQPVFRNCPFVTAGGSREGLNPDAAVLESGEDEGEISSVSEDIFMRGLCLPSDVKNTGEDMGRVKGIICGVLERI